MMEDGEAHEIRKNFFPLASRAPPVYLALEAGAAVESPR
jgi:hypothetical protein